MNDIVIKVVAVNEFGDSEMSEEGSGASIVGDPDAPVDLKNQVAITSSSRIGLTWSDGKKDGGSKILSYCVYYANIGDEDFVKIADKIVGA